MMAQSEKIKITAGEVYFKKYGQIQFKGDYSAAEFREHSFEQLLYLMKYENPISKIEVFLAWLKSYGKLTFEEGMYYTKIQLFVEDSDILKEYKTQEWQRYFWNDDTYKYLFQSFESVFDRIKSSSGAKKTRVPG